LKPILPGSAIGVLGSGQLGRMFAIAARRMGYRVHTLSPDEDTPTGQVADLEINAPYEDLDAIAKFASGVSVVTFEFENVPAATAAAAERCAPVRPAGHILHTTQHRLREKTFLARTPVFPSPHSGALLVSKISPKPPQRSVCLQFSRPPISVMTVKANTALQAQPIFPQPGKLSGKPSRSLKPWSILSVRSPLSLPVLPTAPLSITALLKTSTATASCTPRSLRHVFQTRSLAPLLRSPAPFLKL
jgi:hypothetical protein